MDNRLAVIIPVYNEAKAIHRHMEILLSVLKEDGIDAQIMLVDDGSNDDTWHALSALADTYDNICSLHFSRNFGKEAAICAGLEHIDADRYLVMDSDLQHPPRYIKDMMRIMDETGADIVEGVKQSRGRESLIYKLFANSFYSIMKVVSGLEFDNSSDFKLMQRSVVDALRSLDEGNVFFRGLVNWVGFSRVEMPFTVDDRKNGTSSFSAGHLVKFAINSILSYTSKPLYLTIVLGAAFLIGGAILGIQTLYKFFSGGAVSGFSTVILLLLIIGSLLLLSLGIIGAYISRIYDEVKKRPRYIISGTANNPLISEKKTDEEAK